MFCHPVQCSNWNIIKFSWWGRTPKCSYTGQGYNNNYLHFATTSKASSSWRGQKRGHIWDIYDFQCAILVMGNTRSGVQHLQMHTSKQDGWNVVISCLQSLHTLRYRDWLPWFHGNGNKKDTEQKVQWAEQLSLNVHTVYEREAWFVNLIQ